MKALVVLRPMWYLVHEFPFVLKTALVKSGPGWWEKKIRQLGVCVPSWTEADDTASGCGKMTHRHPQALLGLPYRARKHPLSLSGPRELNQWFHVSQRISPVMLMLFTWLSWGLHFIFNFQLWSYIKTISNIESYLCLYLSNINII